MPSVLPTKEDSTTGGSTNGSNTDRTGIPTGTSTGRNNNSCWIVGDAGSYSGTAADRAASETTAGEGDSGKAYEITGTATAGSQDDTPWTAYAVVGIMSILALAGIRFFLKAVP